MKKFFFSIFSSLIALPIVTYGQSGIVTDNTAPYNSVEYLIQNVLSDGSAGISNVTYTFGDLEQVGYFEDTNPIPILGYSEGLFMATGGPTTISNDVGGTAYTGNPSPYQDPDLDLSLQALFGASYTLPTHDQQNVIVIEFDIEANLDYFEFYYTFASTEYQSFSCSNFNDVFGFYVTGPDPSNPATPYNAKNIALIPTDLTQTSFTTTPVSVNSVNAGTNSDPFGNCEFANDEFEQDSIFFNQNWSPQLYDFSFTGFTIPLRAYVPAVCGQTYHMKLAICDVSDTALRSAVFLKKGSLKSPVDVVAEPAPNVFPDTNGWFYEGCGTTTVKFKRPTTDEFAPGTGDLVVNFNLYGSATYGVDYHFLNNNGATDHIVIPNYASEFILNIEPVEDNIDELPFEDIIFSIPHLTGQSCDDSGFVNLEVKIADHPKLIVDLVDELGTYCPGDEVTFEVSVSGGLPITAADPYAIHWSQIGYNSKQTVSPDSSKTYYVEVKDLCPQLSRVDSIRINVNVWPELVLNPLDDQYACDGDAYQYNLLEGKLFGGEGNYTYSWLRLEDNSVVSTEEDPLLFPGEYTVTIVDGCESVTERNVTIFHYELPDLDIKYKELAAERTLELSINEFPINSNFGFMSIDYVWDFGDGSPTQITKGPIEHEYPEFGIYTVTLTLTNEIGCKKVFTKVVELTPFIVIPTIFTPNGDGSNEGFAPVSSRQYSSYSIVIYDRWGQQVFQSDDITEKWFGKTKDGLVCSEGLYIYHIEIKYPNYEEITKHEGYIHLTR